MKIKKTDIDRAVAHLQAGGIILYPTESSYAFGVDATNSQAVKLLQKLKRRLPVKPFPLIVADIAMAKKFAHLSGLAAKLAIKHWPGPLTLVLPARRVFPGGVKNTQNEIAVRVSSQLVARNLSKSLGRPLVATSANVSNRPAGYSLTAIKKQFNVREWRQVLALNSGSLPLRPVSTIIKITKSGLKLIRRGAIKKI